MMQRVKRLREIALGVGNAGEGQHPVLEALDGAPGDVRLAKVGERLAEELELARDRRAGFGDGLDQGGEILRRDEIGVGATKAEMGFDELDLAQGVHVAGAGRLVEKIGEIKEIDHTRKRTFRAHGSLGHEGEASGLLAEAAHDEARVAERHAGDDKAPDSLRFGHEVTLGRINQINKSHDFCKEMPDSVTI